MLPPASERIVAFCAPPAGPTTRTSMSAGKVWVSERSVTVHREASVDSPETAMLAG